MQKPNIGDRIRLTHMADDPDPIPAGATGTVLNVVSFDFYEDFTVTVDWDCKRTLNLVCPPDRFIVLESASSTRED